MGRAEGDALGEIRAAEVALVRLAGLVQVLDHPEGAGADACSAPYALHLVHGDDARRHVLLYGPFRTGLHTPRLVALHAGHRDELGFLHEHFVDDAGLARREFAAMPEGTGHLAALAADALGRLDANQLLHDATSLSESLTTITQAAEISSRSNRFQFPFNAPEASAAEPISPLPSFFNLTEESQ